jgi:hypothetical protein
MMFVASLSVFACSLLCVPILLLAMFVHEREVRGEANSHSSVSLIMLGQYIPIGGNVKLFKPTPSPSPSAHDIVWGCECSHVLSEIFKFFTYSQITFIHVHPSS